MKLIKFEIEDGRLLNITCKRTRFDYLKEIEELEENMKSKDLDHKYFGCGRDIDGNIVFSFRLLDVEKDIKPYIKYSSPEEISLLDMRTDENIKLQNNWNELKKLIDERIGDCRYFLTNADVNYEKENMKKFMWLKEELQVLKSKVQELEQVKDE